MVDVGINEQKFHHQDLSFSKNLSKESNQVARRIINSAIYVEKPLAPAESTVRHDLSEIENRKTKRCTCSVDQKTCPCHCNTVFTIVPPRKNVSTKPSDNTTKVSFTSVSSGSDHEKDLIIKEWIAKKEEERKRKEAKEKMMRDAKTKEREMLLEQERNNFKRWLTNKKKIEMESKKKKVKDLEERQLRELEKEKRQLENQLSFQLWLKKKEEANLEKKIKQQMELLNQLQDKEKQVRDNEKAFNEWLKNSRSKQKPVPMNRGLQSLCSSSSITYINPNPWNPMP